MSILDFTSSPFINSWRRLALFFLVDESGFSVGEKIALIRYLGLDGLAPYSAKTAAGYAGISQARLSALRSELENLALQNNRLNDLPDLDAALAGGDCLDEEKLVLNLRRAQNRLEIGNPARSFRGHPRGTEFKAGDGLGDRARDISFGWFVAPYLIVMNLFNFLAPPSPFHFPVWLASFVLYWVVFFAWQFKSRSRLGPDWLILRALRRLPLLGGLGRPGYLVLRRLIFLACADALTNAQAVLLVGRDDRLFDRPRQELPAETSADERVAVFRDQLIPDLLGALVFDGRILDSHLLLAGIARAYDYCGLAYQQQVSAPPWFFERWYEDPCNPTPGSKKERPATPIASDDAGWSPTFLAEPGDPDLRLSAAPGPDEDPEVLVFHLPPAPSAAL